MEFQHTYKHDPSLIDRTIALLAYMVSNDWLVYDDVIEWKYFPRNWSFVRGIHQSPFNSPHTRP